MEITHSTLEGNVLQEFTKDYLEKHKELIEFVKNETIKQLTLTAVGHQRELLLFRKWQKENWKNVYLYGNKFMVDTYLNKK
jgi:hypothetical protein